MVFMSQKKEKNKDTQTALLKYLKQKQVGFDMEAYNILKKIKLYLIKKHQRPFTFSDAVRELKDRSENAN